MEKQEVIIRFEDVTFRYDLKKVILDEANFTVRKNSKITIMGQNGAGKSTIFKMMTGALKPESGKIHIMNKAKIGISEQMVPEHKLGLTVLEFFKTAFDKEFYGIERNIKDVLYTVNLNVPNDRKVSDLSGGQKARLLLAYALIQEPDILLLDEPTNNLDDEGINHLISFLVMYDKTVIVISHDTEFLSSFTDGVLNLDVHTHKVEQFVGDYYSVVTQIEEQIERERLKNARIIKSVKDRFEKVNKLGGKSVAMRKLARKVREDIERDREEMVELRQEDKSIPEFNIIAQHCPGVVVNIDEVSIIKDHNVVTKKVDINLHRGERMQIIGPNGMGKSTILKAILAGKGSKIADGVRVGYYSQDFSELNLDDTAFNSLKEVMIRDEIQEVYEMAGRFMLPGSLLNNQISSLSEGQKGLLCYARFMLQEPGLLIMDEPTNHINFRHIPVIAEALQEYKGALILVSHLPEFVSKIKIDRELDLRRL
jgi:ATP-binding cassette subfamily F protein 3